MKKFTKIASVLFAMLIAAACLPGCSNANQSKEESKVSTPSTSVASIAQEESKEESSESSVESSKETSKETPKESSKTSSEETSKEESKEVSKESSKETSEVSITSNVESSTSSGSTVEEKLYKLDDAIAYGKIIRRAYVSKVSDTSCSTGLGIDTLIAILSTDNPDTYDFIYKGYRYKIAKKCVELFPEDYVPDFSNKFWFTVSNLL